MQISILTPMNNNNKKMTLQEATKMLNKIFPKQEDKIPEGFETLEEVKSRHMLIKMKKNMNVFLKKIAIRNMYKTENIQS